MSGATLRQATVGLAALAIAAQLGPHCADDQAACAQPEYRSLVLPSKPPGRFPVVIRFKDFEFVIALDDCLAIVKVTRFDDGTPLHTALDYYAVAREVLPPSRTIELGERSGGEVDRFLIKAVERGVAYCVDRKANRLVPTLRVCGTSGPVAPEAGAKWQDSGCSRDVYCLPDGRFLFSGLGICT